MLRCRLLLAFAASLAVLAPASRLAAHGDVTPQAVDTTGLAPIGEDWREENPYRGDGTALAIGSSGYVQNCARCHGLEAISGGLAPDLRYMELGRDGDEWYLERVRRGSIQGGMTRMPAFEGVLSQEALWAIRTYIESRHED